MYESLSGEDIGRVSLCLARELENCNKISIIIQQNFYKIFVIFYKLKCIKVWVVKILEELVYV